MKPKAWLPLLSSPRRAVSCCATRSETGTQQIAPGRGFPVEHFTGAKHPRARGQHVIGVQPIEGHAAGAADGFNEGPRGLKTDRKLLY